MLMEMNKLDRYRVHDSQGRGSKKKFFKQSQYVTENSGTQDILSVRKPVFLQNLSAIYQNRSDISGELTLKIHKKTRENTK